MSVTPRFKATAAEGRAALVGYLPAGYPSVAASIEAMRVLIDSGCDIIEVGMPYSDPVLDGPVIQRATQDALSRGFRTKDAMRIVEAVSGNGVPIVVMTYWNPVEKYGVEAFSRDLAAAGGSGLITPDLIPEEAHEWLAASDAHDLDRIFLVAPSSTQERISKTVAVSRGFVYAQSIMGVTGVRDQTSQAAPSLVARTREATRLPIGVGLGVRNRDHARAVAQYADAVIVGSAMISCLQDHDDEADAMRRLSELTRELRDGASAPTA